MRQTARWLMGTIARVFELKAGSGNGQNILLVRKLRRLRPPVWDHPHRHK